MHPKKSFHLLHPDHQAYLEYSPEFDLNDQSLAIFRQQLEQMSSIATDQQRIAVTDAVHVTLYRPDDIVENAALPVIYYIHGGGFVAGCAAMHAIRHQHYAHQLQCVVAAVDYRLAPEHRFPIPLQDCVAGLKWLIAQAPQLGIDPHRISIMGESAGGGLSAALCLYLKDQPIDRINIKNQILIYPMLDYRTSLSKLDQRNAYVGEFLWTHPLNAYAWQALKGEQQLEENQLGLYSPSHARNFEGLPATFILVGALDLFLEENLDYAKQLSRAGVGLTLEVVAGAIHGFDLFPGKLSEAFQQRILSYLTEVL